MRERGRGFTFTEVIALVALMGFAAAAMTPALFKARQQATRVQCMANLKMIGIATINYCIDNRGYLPLWAEAHRSPLRHGLHAMASANYWDKDALENYAPPLNPNTFADRDPGANIFLLNIQGYLGKWAYAPQGSLLSRTMANIAAAGADPTYLAARFCPGQRAILSDIASQWNGSYLYNPHWAMVDPPYWAGVVAQNPGAANLGVTDTPMTVRYTKLSDIPRDAVLACDMIYDRKTIAHASLDGASAAWTLLFPDSHVAMMTDHYVINALSRNDSAKPGNDRGGVDPAVEQMNVFDDYLDILETEAAGKDPRTTGFFPGANINPRSPLKDRETSLKTLDKVDRY